MDQIRVWRVTVDGHSAVFDRIEDASDYLRGGLSRGDFRADQKIVMESDWMSEEGYRAEVEREDDLKTAE